MKYDAQYNRTNDNIYRDEALNQRERGDNAMVAVRRKNKTNFWLTVALCIVSALLIVSTILWIVNMNRSNDLSMQIENTYQRSFYDLIDNINNAEAKLGKVLASDYDSYSEKMLSEISKNANSASYNLSNLPISLNGIDETKKFINQVGGYTDSLAQKLDKGEKLTKAEKDTLADIHFSIVALKDNLARFNDEVMTKGYNIFKEGNLIDGDYNNFTIKIQGVKSSDVEYPTMIYDGPFSDSEYNREIKGLPQEEITVEQAKRAIFDTYLTLDDSDVKYLAETSGKFSTFDFSVRLESDISMYVQVTKNGGKILTISGYGDQDGRNMSLVDAIAKVKDIAKKQTGVTFDCVWSDIVGQDAYINLAPVQNSIVLYPDLIKAKVDLFSGEMIGYSATSFYTNHTENRQIVPSRITKDIADKKIPNDLKVEMSRLCLAPLDFGQEILCYEYKCTKNNDTYYIYINAQTGITENILKVVETTDGNKLM